MPSHLHPKLDDSSDQRGRGGLVQPPALLPPEGSTLLGPPAGLPQHPSLRRFAFTFLLSTGSLQISSVSSVEGFLWETQSFPLAAGTRKCSPEGLEEPRRKRRGLLPSPLWLSPLFRRLKCLRSLALASQPLPAPAAGSCWGWGSGGGRLDSVSLPYPQATFLVLTLPH